jgi:general secretion pathway protein G
MREQFSRFVKARMDDHNDEQGFTLIELLIVIVVLGILAAVTVFGLSGTASQSAQAACKSDARTVEVAVDAFHANDSLGLWPAALTDLTAPGAGTGAVGGQPAGVAPYLRAAPGNSPHYTISLFNSTAGVGTGEVDVVVPPATTGVNFDTGGGAICDTVK